MKLQSSWLQPSASIFDGHSHQSSATTFQTSVFVRHTLASPSSLSSHPPVYNTALERQTECARKDHRMSLLGCHLYRIGRSSPGHHRTVLEDRQSDVRDRRTLRVVMEPTRTEAICTFALLKYLLAVSLLPLTSNYRQNHRS